MPIVSVTQSRLRSRRTPTVRRRPTDSGPATAEAGAVSNVAERPRARPRREVGRVLLGAAEICLLSKDPHLAVRAAWVLLRDKDAASDADAMGGRALPG